MILKSVEMTNEVSSIFDIMQLDNVESGVVPTAKKGGSVGSGSGMLCHVILHMQLRKPESPWKNMEGSQRYKMSGLTFPRDLKR